MMRKIIYISLLCFFAALQLNAEDGSRLWLRFQPGEKGELPFYTGLNGNSSSIAVQEFQQAWEELSGKSLSATSNLSNNTLLIGTAKHSDIRRLNISKELEELGPEGYIIRTVLRGKNHITVVASSEEKGLLYGVFHLLRLIQTKQSLNSLDIREKPLYDLRLLNHWDNLNGTIERGYAGYSIWKW